MYLSAMPQFLRIVFIFAGLFFSFSADLLFAAPRKRVALVIGNGKYLNVNQLPNAQNDANELEKKLKRLGFNVILAIDADNRTFMAREAEFSSKITPNSIALFFYAGHGIDVEGEAYVLPVDVAINNELGDVQTVTAAIPLSKIITSMSRSHILLVFLDACRNKPDVNFRATEADGRSRALTVTAGFQPRGIEKSVPRQSSGMMRNSNVFFIYSTSLNATASDGLYGNSPFTRALLKNIETENLTIEQLGRRIIDAVEKETENQQSPWTIGSLKDEFSFNPRPIKASSPVRRQASPPALVSLPAAPTRTSPQGPLP